MKKLVKFGIAILTLVLLVVSFVPTLFLEHGDRLVWQLNNWAWLFSSLLIAIIGVLLTIHYTKGKHILWKTMAWLGCAILAIICLVSFYIAMVMRDEKIWSSKDYVVYSEYDGPIDPHKFVLYKRDGLTSSHHLHRQCRTDQNTRLCIPGVWPTYSDASSTSSESCHALMSGP